jgi:DNA polymerase-3 subunit alpha
MPELVDDFVHLHTHSDMSQLDGCGKISEYVKTAKARGHKALAFTDHGTMRGVMTHYEQCKAADIKPIFGTEFYVSRDMRRRGLTDEEKATITAGAKKADHKLLVKQYEEREGIRDRWHITCWAQTNEGLRNLYKLSSASFIDGFYYKPRVDLAALIEHGAGIHVASGCLSSPINDSWLAGKKRQAFDFADQLQEAFGDRFWLEVQPHAIKDQYIANELMLKLRDRYGGRNKLLATQDAHYVEQADAEHHEVLLCIGTATNLRDPERFKFDGDEFHFRTRKEMFQAFRKHHSHIPKELVREALNSALELADGCTAKIEADYHAALLPDPGVPEKYAGDHFAYLKDLCLGGWAWREIPRRANVYARREKIAPTAALDIYRQRLLMELKALKKQKFVPYFLIIRDLYAFAREAKIMVGPGRGSVGGSLIAFLLGIAATDPIEHGLIFERFISPFRIDMPDVDMDFEDRRRGEIIQYIRQKYGEDKVCQIATIGKLSGKECIRSVSRVLEIPLNEVNQVTNSIIERSSGDERASQTIEDSFKDFEVCREFNKRYPKVLHHARKLEGMAKNLGIHAAGVVASPVPLTDVIPLEVRTHNDEKVIVSAFDMYGVAAAGLVKMDVLGLRTLTVIKEALEAIETRHGRHIDMENPSDVDLNDPKVLQGFTDHEYGGVFQYDTPSADKVCQGVNFNSFEDVAAMTALNRPGTSRSGLATKYVERKKKPHLVKKIDFHPAVSKVTADTLGIIVYQEHVLRIFTEIAGFAPGTADSLRKTIAKKIGDETLGKEREKFVEGAMKHTPGMTEAVANKIMDAITFFGSYGFNKSHATAYGMIAFWCMWIKVYYPVEFYWALLKNEPERIRIQQIAKDAKRHGIELKPPHVSTSKTHFVIDGALAIRGSLVDIKGVGEGAAGAIMAAQPYASIQDFAARVERRKCNRGAVVALAKAGALDGLVPNVRWFIENADAAWGALTSKRKSDTLEKTTAMLEASRAEPDYNEEDKLLVSSQVSPLAFGRHPIDAYASFMAESVKVPITEMGSDDYFKDFDGKGHYIAGVIVEVKYNQIGDFHTGTLPSQEEREQQFWGARYANVNIEERSGKQNRVKFDFHLFDDFREIIDKGLGTPVIVHVTASNFTQTLRAQYAVDIAAFRQKVRKGEELGLWERIVMGRHPSRYYPWKDKAHLKARYTNKKFWESTRGGLFTGIVTDVRPKYDRKGGLMAYFGLLGGDQRWIEVMCFASVWEDVLSVVKVGRLLTVNIERSPDRLRGGLANIFNGGTLKVLKKAELPSAKPVAAE